MRHRDGDCHRRIDRQPVSVTRDYPWWAGDDAVIRLCLSRRLEMNGMRLPFVAFALLPLGLAGIVPSFDTPIGAQPEAAQAASARVFTFDVAADCRTFVPGLSRGETNMVTGKIFPGGALPAGIANNDPVLPVHGVAPIGDWHHRSQTV